MGVYSMPRPWLILNDESDGQWVDIDTDVEGNTMTLICTNESGEKARLHIDAFKLGLIWVELRRKQHEQREEANGNND